MGNRHARASSGGREMAGLIEFDAVNACARPARGSNTTSRPKFDP